MKSIKKALKRIIPGMLSAAVAFGAFGANIQAKENDITPVDEVEEPLSFQADYVDFSTDESRKELLDESESFPSSFDLRNLDTDGDGVGECYVTPVKLQSPFGTCWGFAAAAAAEISLLGSIFGEDWEAYKTLDLSEKQLAFFSNKYLNDKKNRQNREGTYLRVSGSSSLYYRGGWPYMAASIFAQGIGPVNESRGEEFVYKGKNGYREKQMIDGIYQDYSYSERDDWFLSENERFQQDYILSESTLLPSPAGYNENKEYFFNEAGVAAIKEELMKIRGVVVSFHADASMPKDESGNASFIQTKNWAHYTYEYSSPNHAVTIIGWDDNYPKENFISGHQPPADGAFLVKNSWGSGEEEFPNKGSGHWGIEVPKKDEKGNVVTDENGDPVMVGSGYFWLSYYDRSLKEPETFSFDIYKGTAGYYLDEHNLMPVSEPGASIFEDEVKVANIFYPEGSELLHSASYETRNPNTTVTCEVYLLSEDADSPEDGILIDRNEASYKYGGFHKINLIHPVLLQKDQPYSIVITEKQENGCYAVPLAIGYGWDRYSDSYQKAVINERESMVCLNGNWYDYSQEDVQYAIVSEGEARARNFVFDNFPIKGYGFIEEVNTGMEVSGGNPRGKMLLSEGYDAADYSLSFTGEMGYSIGKDDIEWSLADGGDAIVEMTVSEDSLKAHLKAKKVGSTYLIVNVKGVGTRVLAINVASAQEPDEPDSLKPSDSAFVIKPAKAEITNVTVGTDSAVVSVKDASEWGISGYKLAYREAGTEEWITKIFGPESPELTVNDLIAGKEYEFMVCGYIDIPEEQRQGDKAASCDGEFSEVVKTSTSEVPEQATAPTNPTDDAKPSDPGTPDEAAPGKNPTSDPGPGKKSAAAKPGSVKSAKTGDNNDLRIWIAVAAAAAAAGITTVVLRKRRQR